MPRADAAATSMVLYPAPARTMRARAPASIIASVTLVERTTSTPALLSASAAASASSLRAGSYTTSQPAPRKPSIPLCSNWSATSTFISGSRLLRSAQSDEMGQQTVAELRLEPRGFGRHDPARVCDGHQVGDADRVQRERDGRLPAIDRALERRRAADASHEVDALVGAGVRDTE